MIRNLKYLTKINCVLMFRCVGLVLCWWENLELIISRELFWSSVYKCINNQGISKIKCMYLIMSSAHESYPWSRRKPMGHHSLGQPEMMNAPSTQNVPASSRMTIYPLKNTSMKFWIDRCIYYQTRGRMAWQQFLQNSFPLGIWILVLPLCIEIQ